MNRSKEAILTEMGFTLWTLRHPGASESPVQDVVEQAVLPPEPAESLPPSVPVVSSPVAGKPSGEAFPVAEMGWDELSAAVQECRNCDLCQHRRQAVLGVGDRQADVLFIGEGPGAEEDARGEPFVGQAGRLLDAMLAAIGLDRHHGVYIANAVKCRPQGNRTPLPREISSCKPFLMRQIELVQPRLIILLGKTAVQCILQEEKSLASMRQKKWQFEDVPVLVSYHPAYLLRNLPDKAKAWEDLCLARRVMKDIG